MKLYNTLSRQVQELIPGGAPLTLYVCGITPYDTTHLGHAFTYTVADNLVRYLEYRGTEVCYLQNLTDIDDDLLLKAQQVQENWWALGNRWTIRYIEDMQSLNVRAPDFYIRATESIPDVIHFVRELLDRGVAYESAENVYFDTALWPEFGELSRFTWRQMLQVANERGNHPDDPHKRTPHDFILWQAQTAGEPAWDSPWGKGRPGWHTQCATMITRILGPSIDLHLGGEDLIFPHHESVIAQAEAVTRQRPLVRHWVHVAMVRHQGKKMSKSLGNLILVRDLFEEFGSDALRLYLAIHHYRSPWNHSLQALKYSASLAKQFQRSAGLASGEDDPFDPRPYEAEFKAAMDNDLDTPIAISSLKTLSDEITQAAGKGRGIAAAQRKLLELAAVLGLSLNRSGRDVRAERDWKVHLQRVRGAERAGRSPERATT